MLAGYLLAMALCTDVTSVLAKLDLNEAFSLYMMLFNKSYFSDSAREQALRHFGASHGILRSSKLGTAVLKLTNMSDQRRGIGFASVSDLLPHFTRIHNDLGENKTTNMCYTDAKSFVNPLPYLAEIPATFDLRELGLQTAVKDQGKCHASYAFAAVSMLESFILFDATFYSQILKYSSVFPYTANNLSLSEQYLMNASFGANNYCEGGSFMATMNFLSNTPDTTVELNLNFPYTAADTSVNPTNIPSVSPVIPQESYLLPYYYACKQNCNVSLAVLVADDSLPFDEKDIFIVKTYIARGIPVAIAVSVRTDGDASEAALSAYTSGVFSYPCVVNKPDHQMVLVGYGYVNGSAVWVVRNSWGPHWGVLGYAYFESGRDVLCSEHSALTALPQHIDRASQEIYVQNPNAALIYSDSLVRGVNGLDDVSGFIREGANSDVGLIVGAFVGAFVGLGAIVAIALIIRKRIAKKREDFRELAPLNDIDS